MTLTRKAAASTAFALCLAAGAGLGQTAAIAAPATEHGKTAKVILADSLRALAKVKSLHVAGTALDGKDKFTLVASFESGVGGTAHIVDGKAVADIVSIGKYTYLKGNAALYGTEASPVVDGHWVRVSTNGKAGKDFSYAVNLKAFAASQTTSTLSSKVTTEKFRGIAADVLTDNSDHSHFILNDADALPLEETGAGGKGALLFTYNVKVTLKAPASYLVLNV